MGGGEEGMFGAALFGGAKGFGDGGVHGVLVDERSAAASNLSDVRFDFEGEYWYVEPASHQLMIQILLLACNYICERRVKD